MSQSIFVSFAGTDRGWLPTIKNWGQKGLLGPGVVVTGERGYFTPEGDSAVKREIISMIQGASMVLFVIGNNTHNRYWVDYEVMQAQQRRKRIIVARIPNTTGATPAALRRYPIITLHPDSIRQHL